MPSEATAVTTAEVVTTPTPDVSMDGATAEIPFVPASLRQTAKPDVIDDTIVVVGQRQKKRKRAKKAGPTDDGGDGEKSTAAKAKGKAEEVVVPFDFESAPNILDDGAAGEQEDGRTGKRKRQKRGGGFLGAWDYCSLPPVSPYGTDGRSREQNVGTSRRRQKTGGR